jgi:hypothetical protein
MDEIPDVSDWYELTKRKDKFGMGSHPNQPDCKCSSKACSEFMKKPDLCFWHFHRMGKVGKAKCACGTWNTVSGDAVGRNQAIDYYDLERYETAVVDMGYTFYCCPSCQNRDNYKWRCGSMYVCSNNEDKHDKSMMMPASIEDDFPSSDDAVEEGKPVWPHDEAYKDALMMWITTGRPFKYVIMGPDGPSVNVKDPEYGAVTVNNAANALRAACHDHEFAEWWTWFAGWFPDCPPNIKSHIKK